MVRKACRFVQQGGERSTGKSQIDTKVSCSVIISPSLNVSHELSNGLHLPSPPSCLGRGSQKRGLSSPAVPRLDGKKRELNRPVKQQWLLSPIPACLLRFIAGCPEPFSGHSSQDAVEVSIECRGVSRHAPFKVLFCPRLILFSLLGVVSSGGG
jgi:hypothetical protein